MENIKKSDGTRLVGARAADHGSQAPFLVALNIHGQTWSACTGSLITPIFLITASHCTDYIPKSGRLEKNKQCVEQTAAGQKYHSNRFTLQCRIVTTFERKKKQRINNLEIVSLNPIGKAWMGVNDMNNWTNVDSGSLSNIKRTIMPEHAYQGGNDYGDYGGYDIAIMELEHPLNTFQPACLPSPSFNDYANSKLAGYGKYFRTSGSGQDICQTNQYGPMKYHYCKSKCSTKKPPPTSGICRSFFKNHNVPDQKEEVMIMKGKRTNFCFRSENKEDKAIFKKIELLLLFSIQLCLSLFCKIYFFKILTELWLVLYKRGLLSY